MRYKGGGVSTMSACNVTEFMDGPVWVSFLDYHHQLDNHELDLSLNQRNCFTL